MEELNLHLRRTLAALSLHHPAQRGCSLVLASFLAQEARREVLRSQSQKNWYLRKGKGSADFSRMP